MTALTTSPRRDPPDPEPRSRLRYLRDQYDQFAGEMADAARDLTHLLETIGHRNRTTADIRAIQAAGDRLAMAKQATANARRLLDSAEDLWAMYERDNGDAPQTRQNRP